MKHAQLLVFSIIVVSFCLFSEIKSHRNILSKAALTSNSDNCTNKCNGNNIFHKLFKIRMSKNSLLLKIQAAIRLQIIPMRKHGKLKYIKKNYSARTYTPNGQ